MLRAKALIVLAAVAALGACSRYDSAKASGDLKDAGHQVNNDVSKIGRNPDVRRAEADFRHAGHEFAIDARKAAAEAKAAAHKLADQTKGAAHDVTHHDGDEHQDRDS